MSQEICCRLVYIQDCIYVQYTVYFLLVYKETDRVLFIIKHFLKSRLAPSLYQPHSTNLNLLLTEKKDEVFYLLENNLGKVFFF